MSGLGRFLAMRLQGALAAALVLTALGLTACSDDDLVPPPPATTTRPPATPSPTPSPTPTPTPTAEGFDATVPPEPPEALGGPPSPEAASEVAQYFISLFPYAQATGDLEAWSTLSGRYCDYCANAQRMVEDLVAANQHSTGGRIQVTEARASELKAGEYGVLLWFTEHPSQTLDADGRVVEDFPETARVSADMHVVWRDSGWSVEAAAVELLGQS